jgi:hypothetical protein
LISFIFYDFLIFSQLVGVVWLLAFAASWFGIRSGRRLERVFIRAIAREMIGFVINRID